MRADEVIELGVIVLRLLTAAFGRFCCKSLFALLIKNSLGRRRDFRVKMWGTSSPDRKLTGDLGNAIEMTEKRLGLASLGPILQSLGLKLLVVEDEEAFAKVKPRLQQRKISRPG